MEDGVFQPTHGWHAARGRHFSLACQHRPEQLDWRLHDAGFRFVRYADDFVVLCRTATEVQEAHALVQEHLTQLGLTLSAEKTKRTQFREGFAFLGFVLSSWTVTMRPKSVEKFKAKIRELTPRSHNLDADVVGKINAGGARHGELFRHLVFELSDGAGQTWTAGCGCVSAA